MLHRLFVFQLTPAWARNVGQRLTEMPKLHLVDTCTEEDAYELIFDIEMLAVIPELNVTSGPAFAERIDFDRAIADGEVLYFCLTPRPSQPIARFIGSIAVEKFYEAPCRHNTAIDARGMHVNRFKRAYALVDEFQFLAARNQRPSWKRRAARGSGSGSRARCPKSSSGRCASSSRRTWPSGSTSPCATSAMRRSSRSSRAPPSMVSGASRIFYDTEVSERGSKAAWVEGFLLTPGRHVALFVNDAVGGGTLCPSDSLAPMYVAGASGVGPVGAAMVGIAHGIGRAIEETPAVVEFTVEAGKSYVVDCDRDWTPWVRVTPEEDR